MQFTSFALLLQVAIALAYPRDYIEAESSEQCTSTITEIRPFGCIIATAAHNATTSIDCDGCVLKTEQGWNTLLGHGPVCPSGLITSKSKGCKRCVDLRLPFASF